MFQNRRTQAKISVLISRNNETPQTFVERMKGEGWIIPANVCIIISASCAMLVPGDYSTVRVYKLDPNYSNEDEVVDEKDVFPRKSSLFRFK